MYTLFLYNSILILCFIFSYIAEKGSTAKLRLFARFIVFLVLLIPAALRYETGTDYGAYVRMFFSDTKLAAKEPLWMFLNKFVASLNLSVQWIFVFAAILIYYPICFKLERKHYCLSIVLYVILGFYFKSYNGLRQMIAVSFVLWAIIDIEKKKYIKPIFLLVIGYFFHTSVLFVFPCLLLSKIKLKGKIFPFFVLLLGCMLIIKLNFLEIAFKLLSIMGSHYARFEGGKYAEKMELGTGVGVILKLGFTILACFFYGKILSKEPQKQVALNLTIVYVWTYLLAAQFVIMGRLRDLFIFIPLIISGYAVEYAGKYKKIIKVILVVVTLILFEYDIPKQTRDNFSNSTYPYYSIFYKGEIK